MRHIRGAPHHPQTPGKIERWHEPLKNNILLNNYYLPGDLEQEIGTFFNYHNHHRYHESLKDVTSADVYFGRHYAVLKRRNEINDKTIKARRSIHQSKAA